MNDDTLRRELLDLIPRLERTPPSETTEQLISRLTRLAEARAALVTLRRRSAAA
ncbi:hypothetical protein [Deinococcus arenicola]|uniref:Uncharacterized protein n=1 Tax=Deinococcus arenicola TaxID=2994950 RepID=A0ABU4DVM6_9DEIO|nr:hypothetical protein [Deinococcus sp. ZS9-10]MDV6376438.1 hypothetical protein [Deinococcus sp. ZS9-10]